MPRKLPVRFIWCLICVVAAMPFVTTLASAESTITVSGGFTTADAGTFGVTVSAKPDGGCGDANVAATSFGAFAVNAVGGANGVVPVTLALCISYTDTRAERGPLTIYLSVPSFQFDPGQSPSFYGSDQVSLEIPNRYLVLGSVGSIEGGTLGDGVGSLSAVKSGEGNAFDGGSLPIAHAEQGAGVTAAWQEVDITLNIPAGIYPGIYVSTLSLDMVIEA